MHLIKLISKLPVCVGPSSPTMPALSIAKVTSIFSKHTSCMNWSYPLCKNVEYIATTGFKPSKDNPAAKVTECCSAIATS